MEVAIDIAKYTEEKFCNNCGLIHNYKNKCPALSVAYDLKLGVGKCPHCKTVYKTDTTEPVEVYVPWENRLVWRSCWCCFVKKLEG